MVAFTRVSDQEIRERFGIYEPDCLIILDSSLTHREGHRFGSEGGPLDHHQQRQEAGGLSSFWVPIGWQPSMPIPFH